VCVCICVCVQLCVCAFVCACVHFSHECVPKNMRGKEGAVGNGKFDDAVGREHRVAPGGSKMRVDSNHGSDYIRFGPNTGEERNKAGSHADAARQAHKVCDAHCTRRGRAFVTFKGNPSCVRTRRLAVWRWRRPRRPRCWERARARSCARACLPVNAVPHSLVRVQNLISPARRPS
jgi:hypothetical protein